MRGALSTERTTAITSRLTETEAASANTRLTHMRAHPIPPAASEIMCSQTTRSPVWSLGPTATQLADQHSRDSEDHRPGKRRHPDESEPANDAGCNGNTTGWEYLPRWCDLTDCDLTGCNPCDACDADCNLPVFTRLTPRLSTLITVAAALVPNIGTGWLILGLIGVYRRHLTHLTPACPSAPSCSSYALNAIERLGPRQGLLAAAARIRDCGTAGPHPLRGQTTAGALRTELVTNHPLAPVRVTVSRTYSQRHIRWLRKGRKSWAPSLRSPVPPQLESL